VGDLGGLEIQSHSLIQNQVFVMAMNLPHWSEFILLISTSRTLNVWKRDDFFEHDSRVVEFCLEENAHFVPNGRMLQG
jgi:hypothetical protein